MQSFGVGILSQEIWNRRSTRTQGEFALLCGLLHDLGKIVYFKKDAAAYSRLFLLEKGPDDPDICACEIRNYEVDHAMLGALLIRQWRLPQELATVVQHHHDSCVGGLPLAAAVSMADMFAKQVGIGYDGDRKISADLPGLMNLLKMDQVEFDSLSTFAGGRRAQVEEFFQLVS
jgi:putative nucleotidyltransferase with HDIG domain